jgi:hypothetical protein
MNTRNHAVKVIAVAFTAAIVLFANPLISRANGGGIKKSSSLSEAQVSVKYEGISDNSIVFKLDFENPTGEKFWLIIKNDNNDVVYHQQFSDTHFSKAVFFQNTDFDIHPTFVIRSNDNTEVVRQFQVSKTLTETTMAIGL